MYFCFSFHGCLSGFWVLIYFFWVSVEWWRRRDSLVVEISGGKVPTTSECFSSPWNSSPQTRAEEL
ncbi:unnamed protein product [Linum tenue]|uniref:Uncharacterized protein n=1 Tax=Linum tenue TaxID=586396 RepID=A0AAV0GYG7_9ROSI|nr:unnamed protein product [Linum tenue]